MHTSRKAMVGSKLNLKELYLMINNFLKWKHEVTMFRKLVKIEYILNKVELMEWRSAAVKPIPKEKVLIFVQVRSCEF